MIYMFRGSEADADHCPVPCFEESTQPAPLADEQPTWPVSDWPARRAERIVTTSRGVAIGGAYVRPPPRPSCDAETIQKALLSRDAQVAALSHKWAFRCVCAIGVYALVALYMGWWK